MGWTTEIAKSHTISCNTPDCKSTEDSNRYYKKDAEQFFKTLGWTFLKFGHKCPGCTLREM